MAAQKESPDENEEGTAEGSPKKNKLMLFGGSTIAVIAAAFITATLAAPAKKEYKVFEGPWITPLTPQKIQVNLKGEDRVRFQVFVAEAYFEAYEQQYALDRAVDPAYVALVKDMVVRVSSRRTVEEINSEVGRTAFREDMRQSIDPLLFPVHVGKTATPSELDPRSGLKVGTSSIRSNFRIPLYDGVLHVDEPGKTIRLGRGQPVPFDGTEKDLRVEDEHGRYVFLDVSRLESGFRGEVPIGVHGRIREILLTEWNTQ